MPIRDLTTELLDAIVNEKPTLQVCIKITAKDGTVIGFTRNQKSISLGGVTYLSAPGLSFTNISSGLGLSVDNLETGGAFKDGVLTEAQVRYGKWDFAKYLIFVIDLDNLAADKMELQGGRVREIRIQDYAFTAELSSLSQLTNQTTGELTSARCRARAGDLRCKLDLEAGTHPTLSHPYKMTGTVSLFVNKVTFKIASTTYPTEFFQNGKLIWLTGANQGIKSEVKQQVNDGSANTFLLQEPPGVAPIAAGDTFAVYWGCNGTMTRCKTVNNVINMRAEPWLVGQKLLLTSK